MGRASMKAMVMRQYGTIFVMAVLLLSAACGGGATLQKSETRGEAAGTPALRAGKTVWELSGRGSKQPSKDTEFAAKGSWDLAYQYDCSEATLGFFAVQGYTADGVLVFATRTRTGRGEGVEHYPAGEGRLPASGTYRLNISASGSYGECSWHIIVTQ